MTPWHDGYPRPPQTLQSDEGLVSRVQGCAAQSGCNRRQPAGVQAPPQTRAESFSRAQIGSGCSGGSDPHYSGDQWRQPTAGRWCESCRPPPQVSVAPQRRCSGAWKRCATPKQCPRSDAPLGSPRAHSHPLTTPPSSSSCRVRVRARQRAVRQVVSVIRARLRDQPTMPQPPQDV